MFLFCFVLNCKVAKEDTFAASLARKRLMEESQIGNSNDGAISDPNYKMSELERKRRLLTKYRESTGPSENLTPYELAIREQKRDDEKKKKEETIKKRRVELEEDNNLRLDKNIFTILSLFKGKNGAQSKPALLTNLKRVFKFDVEKVMSVTKDKEDQVTVIQ